MPYLQVSGVVAEVLGHNVPSPPAGSSKPAVPRALNVKTRSPRSKKLRGRKEFVRMQVRSEVMLQPQETGMLYQREEIVSKEEADFHEET